MDNKTNLLGIIKTLFKWRWPLLIIGAATFVGACLISLLLPNYYQASTLFYAASEDLAKPESLFAERGSNIKTQYYGNEDDVERLITVAQSNELKDYLITKFDLYSHYKIDSSGKNAKYRLRKKFNKYYEIMKTDRDALQLSFEDKDPAFAAEIVKSARAQIEEIAIGLIKNNIAKTLEANRQNIKDKSVQLQEASDSLSILRERYGIYNGLTQTEEFASIVTSSQIALNNEGARLEQLQNTRGIERDTITYLTAKVNGMKIAMDSLNKKLEKFREGITPILNLEKTFFDLGQRIAEDQERTRVLEATYKAEVPAVLVVEEAEVPLYKSRPSRSILVILATLIVSMFTAFGILLFEYYKDVNWKEIFDA
ncbi:MAG: Wzz/FepE/Etk N-terminal domain-containing protein [Bacteroidota bacterium]